jgi:GR25 family glycosyltransferase involved in LPS biosynthesis
VDAREEDNLRDGLVNPIYTLGDQLFVDPYPLASPDRLDLDEPIEMTPQEIAVACSHIDVWRRIARGPDTAALVLEDDIWFSPRFAHLVERAWSELFRFGSDAAAIDLLYVSYREVRHGAEKVRVSPSLFRPFRGLWNLSGYVLFRSGAEKLVRSLPVRGPVDLWLNHQFARLNVYAIAKSVISQRLDHVSDNSYSALPALARIGILNRETPGLFRGRPMLRPVFAFGVPGSGLSSLAMALSMLGYRCCSDIDRLPDGEMQRLLQRAPDRVFDAYVNVGSLEHRMDRLARLYPDARFIRTTATSDEDDDRPMVSRPITPGKAPFQTRTLILPSGGPRMWKALCEFLRCVPPPYPYPKRADVGMQRLDDAGPSPPGGYLSHSRRLQFDDAPWVAPAADRDWRGVPSTVTIECDTHHEYWAIVDAFRRLDLSLWKLREDTFPANLALFTSTNFVACGDGPAQLILRREDMGVRRYSAAALSSIPRFLHGRFEAGLRPPRVGGVVTGVFLHRDSPRQEIDIEFVGRHPRHMLTNVYYNPGGDGARYDYGFRGTPILVELGFDATADFHSYAIEWSPDQICWFVDGRLVHRRVNWDPTPIPHLPMQFHVNVWPCRSRELAGSIQVRRLPAVCRVRSVKIAPRMIIETKAAWRRECPRQGHAEPDTSRMCR